MPGLVPGIHVLANLLQEKSWMAGTSPRPSGTDCASCGYLQVEASAGSVTTSRRPGDGWLEIEFDLVWCWALRGFFLKKSSNRSPMHEIGADQPGEGERTFHDGVGIVSQAQQQEGDQGNRDLNADGILGSSEEVGDLQGLLDPSKEQLDRPSALVQIGDVLSAGGQIVGEDAQHLAGLDHDPDFPDQARHRIAAGSGEPL